MATGRAKGEIERKRTQRRHCANQRYSTRHPERARQERALRLEQGALEDWKHKVEGTPETHQKASRQQQGALSRLYQRGSIDIEQLTWAVEIAGVHERIGADVGIRTVSLETRIDGGGRGNGAFWEALANVRREIAYTRWRQVLPGPVSLIIDMICRDIGYSVAARRHSVGAKQAKRYLIEAIDLWPGLLADARQEVDDAELAAVHAGLM